MTFLNSFCAAKQHEIILRCRHARPAECLAYQQWGNIVLQLDSRTAVKFGPGVSKDEADNQAAVSTMVNQEIVRVPKVYDWFQDAEGWGYLVMEFMAGERARHLSEDNYISKVSNVVGHLHSLTATHIGPLHQGPHRGIIFGENSSPVLKSTKEVEAWFTRRLCNDNGKVDFGRFDLVLCHLDFTCRNVLWIDGQPPCLLDWACAGFYPRFFEKLSLDIVGQSEDGRVIADMPLSDAEMEQYWLVATAFANEMRYC